MTLLPPTAPPPTVNARTAGFTVVVTSAPAAAMPPSGSVISNARTSPVAGKNSTAESSPEKKGERTGGPQPEVKEGAVSRFTLQGMHCANCAAAVEKAFSNAEGVKSAVVNFAMERLIVAHEPFVTQKDIAQRVEKAGYRIVPIETGETGTVKIRIEDSAGSRLVLPESFPLSIGGVEADLILLAMGFVHPVHEGLLQELGVDLDSRKNIQVMRHDQN